MLPSSSAVRPALSYLYVIAGRLLCVQAVDDFSAKFVDRLMREFSLAASAAADGGTISQTLRVSSSPPPSHPPSSDLETFEIAFGHCATDGSTYYLHVEDSLIVVGPYGSGVVEVWIGDTGHARQPVSLGNLMSYAWQATLRRSNLFQLHGAGVVEPEQGAGALVVGVSRSGKSTLTIRLAASGWGYLTDDTLLLDKNGGAVRAWAGRRFFAAAEDSLAACELPRIDEALGAPILSDPRKRRLEPSVLFPDNFAESCVPRTIFFSHLTGEAESRAAALSQSEAMGQLIKFCPWASYDVFVAREHLVVLSDLAKQCRAFMLYAGLDILNDTRRAAQLLAPLVREPGNI